MSQFYNKLHKYSSPIVPAIPYTNSNGLGCQAAYQTAALSDHPNFRHGAAIVRGGRLVSLGVNQSKTSCFMLNHFRYRVVLIDKNHAEVSSIIKAKQDLKGATIFVARVMSRGNLGSSRPCLLCLSIIKEAGIKKMVYSNDDGTWNEEKLRDIT